ncbi:TPA: type IV secretion system DNA-binding domain-containing protein [Burkholderia vietnamiensis]|uniref:type IV secretion system DNA-binding domain-containing protein n=2 Tax=Burkholderiaceae TaxID=119060 RepID=UPI001B9DF5DC|nr:type IV secretion system DNA-binding domain-containing protein [Burkholderia vietnamiensis]MBR8013449.1 type IV secretion system DNA-binding domain-containing protein [Burkholderia vietnamiensis]HDR9039771.1 type IV secretion system DNA-binding domain-containing protein [Burkholderia vietnamiensis]HDR9196448.1 type IV secretion system DNA-binding domain-containing protein [Burkholderia vietnamiensis]
MKKVRYLSSSNMDDMLTPDTPRRYYNQILGWLCFLFVVFSFSLGMFFFKNIPFFKILLAIIHHDSEYLSYFNMSIFYGKCFFVFFPSGLASWFLTGLITPPITRQTHLAGNFLDDSAQVIKNYETDFKTPEDKKDIAFIRSNEIDFNLCGKQFPNYADGVPVKRTVYLPPNILELSTIVRGEAGSGKSVVLNRYIKEAIDNKHKVILHSVKGDEIEMLSGYCDFYLIQPWESKGYALDFLNMLVSNSEAVEKARIRTFVESFTQAKEGKADFFNKGSIAVLEGLVRCVVSESKENGVVLANPGNIVKLWNQFQVNPVDEDIDLSDEKAVKKEVDKNNQQLQLIKDFLVQWNRPATVYVDPQNAKTSLCVLASCAETIRRFEVLSDFWKDRKTLNIRKWLKTEPKKDRKVIILVNSNQFGDVANCYISAFINLIVDEVIEESYKVKHQLHFILDEFPQLTAIDLQKFLKLPDVGRGKGIRVRVALQRTSQIKSSFNMDGDSFAGAFQNKIWARMASDDFPNIERELGKRDIAETISTANYGNGSQGKSINSKQQKSKVDVANVNELQNILGPVATDKFIGVRVLFKFTNNPRVGVVLLPAVKFDKKERRNIIVSSSGSNVNKKANTHSEDDKEEITIQNEVIHDIDVLHLDPPTVGHEEENPMSSAMVEIGAHAIGGEALSIAVQTGELLDALTTTHSGSGNIIQSNETTLEQRIENKINRNVDSLKKLALLRKTEITHDGDLEL